MKRSSSFRSVDNHFFAAWKVFALSLTISSGAPRQATNSFTLRLNSSTVISLHSFKCTALVLAHVKSVTWALPVSRLPDLYKRGPAKSTPVTLNASVNSVLNFGKAAVGGAPRTFTRFFFCSGYICGVRS